MNTIPLTHHDMIKLVGAFTELGWQVDMGSSDRSARYIQFKSQAAKTPGAHLLYSLQAEETGRHLITRVLLHESGIAATISTTTSNISQAMAAFASVSEERQLVVDAHRIIAFSYEMDTPSGQNVAPETAKLVFACARVSGLELRVDTSTGGAMPADVRLLIPARNPGHLRETLASGSVIPLMHRAARQTSMRSANMGNYGDEPHVTNLPDDFLAVLGPQWRPLLNQGDHWKGVLRAIGKEPARTHRAEQYIKAAVEHISSTLSQPPSTYHAKLHKSRWRVHNRRLKPLMLFFAILALMPISWLLLSTGQMVLHPLALGLTPLLMVGVVVVTAREIPVMEIPPRPAAIPETFWSVKPRPATPDNIHHESTG